MTTEPPQGPIRGQVLPPDGRPGTNSLAVVSLVLGLVSVVLAVGSVFLTFVCCGGFPFVGLGLVLGASAAVCGHLALRQVSGTGQSGREMAVAGLATGYGGAGLSVLVVLLMLLGLGLFAAASVAGHTDGA